MNRQKPISARELVDQLENDPLYLARREAKEAKLKPTWEARAKDQAELVQEIRNCGYAIDSVYDLVNNEPHAIIERKFTGSYKRAYPVLLRHLDLPHERIIREGIIRALTVKDGGREVEDALLLQFLSESDQHTKWVIAIALSVAMPYHRRKKHSEIRQILAQSKHNEQDGSG